MPSGGQFGARPAASMPAYPGYSNFREAQPTFCAFMPTDGGQFPAYYEQTTTVAPTHAKTDSWGRRKDGEKGESKEREWNFEIFFGGVCCGLVGLSQPLRVNIFEIFGL